MLVESAAQPGFVRAAARFVAELEALDGGTGPPHAGACASGRAMGRAGPTRTRWPRLYRGYREGLEAAGLLDPELFAWRAVDALRTTRAWGATPMFVYGFDDFTALELDALDTVANWCDADVTVSLPYERGRLAFKAVAATYQGLLALGAAEFECPRSTITTRVSRAPPSTTSSGCCSRTSRPPAWSPAVPSRSTPPAASEPRWSSRPRACSSCCATASCRATLRWCSAIPGRYSSLLEQVFGAYGIPYSIDRTVPFGHTGLGRGLLAQ